MMSDFHSFYEVKVSKIFFYFSHEFCWSLAALEIYKPITETTTSLYLKNAQNTAMIPNEA